MSPRQLSDLLLIDVEAGVCEKATRIQEAITAVQNFVRRARLGLESGWTVNRDFALMWDREFASLEIWQACRRRRLYKENWLEWGEMGKARRVEAFRFLETKLKSAALTAAVPGGLEWWPDEHVPVHPGLEPLQQHEPAELRLLTKPREGLNLSVLLSAMPARHGSPLSPHPHRRNQQLAGSAASGEQRRRLRLSRLNYRYGWRQPYAWASGSIALPPPASLQRLSPSRTIKAPGRAVPVAVMNADASIQPELTSIISG